MSDSLPSRSFSTRFWLLILVIVAVSAYGFGRSANGLRSIGADARWIGASSSVVRGIHGAPTVALAEDADFQRFWELWDLLKVRFHKQPLSDTEMLYGAMAGLAASTGDPYTVFFDPELAHEFSDSLEGKFEGIGAQIGIKDDQLQIIAPLPDTPADNAGLLPGDAILMINGTSTEGMSVDEAVARIRGKKGTNVVLHLGRLKKTKAEDEEKPSKPEASFFDVTLARDTIVVKSVQVTYLPSQIAEIKITSFNADTAEEFAKIAQEVVQKDVRGIMLDLRNNPGGFLDRATAIAGEWVGDQVVVKERQQDKIVDEYHGTGRGRLRDIPTVVLINEGSASASEIVAGALQDYGVATLIGTTTFGKGSVQDFSEFSDGSAIKITVAEWLTPKDRFINETGITPDIIIERTEEDYHADRDPQRTKAIDFLTRPSSTSPTSTVSAPH